MRIRYRRWVGYGALCMGLLLLVLRAFTGGLSGSDWFLSILLIAIGVQGLAGSYVVVRDNELVAHALLGPLKRSYKFDQLDLQGGRISLVVGGKMRRLAIFRAFARTSDWEALSQLVEEQSVDKLPPDPPK